MGRLAPEILAELKAGGVEALYVAELVGLVFIWSGYLACVQAPRVNASLDQRQTLAEDAPD